MVFSVYQESVFNAFFIVKYFFCGVFDSMSKYLHLESEINSQETNRVLTQECFILDPNLVVPALPFFGGGVKKTTKKEETVKKEVTEKNANLYSIRID